MTEGRLLLGTRLIAFFAALVSTATKFISKARHKNLRLRVALDDQQRKGMRVGHLPFGLIPVTQVAPLSNVEIAG